jgi:tetratricopeptide (TPR) repeat protein
LRVALADDPKQPRYIETASRRGYRFIAPLRPRPAKDPSVALAPSLATPPNLPALAPPALTPTTMIGREAASARLRTAWSAAVAGQRQIVWIVGEAGIGKTTLIENFITGIGPATYAHGQCVEQHGAGEPYLPVLEALGTLCRNDPTLPAMLRSMAPTWFLQFAWLGSEAEREALRRELTGVGQERMLREFGDLIEQYTRDRPLLLVTEDLHWSDQATVHLMDHLARRRNPARFMWLASFRLAEVIAEEHPLKALRHELKLHRLCVEIALDSFSEREVADYLDRNFPAYGASEKLVRALHTRTDGLPLFVVNLIEDLLAQNALAAKTEPPLSDAAISSLQVPENLAGVIEKQIARLTGEECALLEAASVCGVEFRAATLADAMERDMRSVVTLCDDLARRQHWLSGPAVEPRGDGTLDARYTFRHALYRHVFYERIGAMTRAALHDRVAASLERARAAGISVAAVELASHFERGGQLWPALRHYVEAAEAALLRHYAPKEALDLTALALELLPRCPTGSARDELELTIVAVRGVGAAQALGLGAAEPKRALERAQTLLRSFPQHRLGGFVMHEYGLVLMLRGEYVEAHVFAERMLATARQSNDRLLALGAYNLLAQLELRQGRHREAMVWAERGLAECEAVGEREVQAMFPMDPGVLMSGTLATSLLHLGEIDHALAQIETTIDRAHRSSQPMSQLAARWLAAMNYVRLRDVDQVAAHAEALRKIAHDAGLSTRVAPGEWFGGWADAHRSTSLAGFKRIRDAHTNTTKLGLWWGAAEIICLGAEALAAAEDWSQAERELDQAMQLAQRFGERLYLTEMWLLRARIARARGDTKTARNALVAALQEARDQGSIWLELAVRVAQCEAPGATRQDFEVLKQVRAQLKEGADTALLQSADKLLQSRRTAPTT